MKLLSIFIVLLCAAIFYFVASAEETMEESAMAVLLKPLPESLDSLFPPANEKPIFLLQMQAMAGPFTGMVSDQLQGDSGNVNANYADFMDQYLKASSLVPEWHGYFMTAPARELGVALSSGDQAKIMGAFQNMGNVCAACHHINMARAQQKYHWNDFEQIMMTDPVSNLDIPFQQLMMFMETSMTGIAYDLRQGQNENAQNDMQGFRARFSAVSETCNACHDTERKYFIDANIVQMIDQLGNAVNQPQVDHEAVGELQKSIGEESCFKCHLVHIPAAYSRYREMAIESSK